MCKQRSHIKCIGNYVVPDFEEGGTESFYMMILVLIMILIVYSVIILVSWLVWRNKEIFLNYGSLYILEPFFILLFRVCLKKFIMLSML